MRSEGVPAAITGRALARTAVAVRPAWDLVAEEEAVAEGVADGAGRRPNLRNMHLQEHKMRTAASTKRRLMRLTWLAGVAVWACFWASPEVYAQAAASKKAPSAATVASARRFDTPQQAADVLVDAADKFDVAALGQIFGPDGDDIVFSGEFPQDRKHAADFVAQAREKKSISVDPKSGSRAFLLVGNEDWPFPVPLVKRGDQWSFDAKAGWQELLYRRIGANELDAIAICHGYVEAQHEYALRPHEGYDVNQYAQRIVSTSGKQDGLAWQNADGGWDGPIGEKIARAIEQGYSSGADPYHGYFFKILKGQGPAAPLGEMDFVVKGIMIGGFALVAAPAEYGVTGVRTFIVSHDGVVFDRDFGLNTLDEFRRMERFNPDKSWNPVPDEED